MGYTFTVQTDHRALVWLDRMKDTDPRLTMQMEPQFAAVPVHRYTPPGVSNGNADALSRCCYVSVTGRGERYVRLENWQLLTIAIILF